MAGAGAGAGMISKVNQGQFLQTQKHKTIFIQLYKPGKRPAGPVFLVNAEKVKKNFDLMENSTILNPDQKTSRTHAIGHKVWGHSKMGTARAGRPVLLSYADIVGAILLASLSLV